jgi:hypothetical protein
MANPALIGHLRVLACALLITTSVAAVGQETLTLSPDVVAVTTGGRWRSEATAGTYRVVVRTGGSEHVVSVAQIDWIADGGEVVQSTLADTGSWRLDRPQIRGSGASWWVDFAASETHQSPPQSGKWFVRLGSPGDIRTKLSIR